MHVLNVDSCVDPLFGGGTAERTFQMSRHLVRDGVSCTVLTLDLGRPELRSDSLRPANLVVLPCLWQRFYVPRMKWKEVHKLVKAADIIHLMGHWSILNAFVYILIRIEQKPYVVCPAGSLPLFGRSKWLKRLYNTLIGRSIIRKASACIAITHSEFPSFQSYGVPTARISVIPNGICIIDYNLELIHKGDLLWLQDSPYILFMGRLNPIKGPDLLLRAFILVKDRLTQFHLVFAGPDGGMLSTLRELAEREGITDRVHFLGYVEGSVKTVIYHQAKLLVVPSRHEAMSIVALEAGVCGTLVMLTDQCGFADVQLVDPRLEVPASLEGIATGLVTLLECPETVDLINPKWKQFVKNHYSWDSIIIQIINLYKQII